MRPPQRQARSEPIICRFRRQSKILPDERRRSDDQWGSDEVDRTLHSVCGVTGKVL
jgi:hypothetical protein